MTDQPITVVFDNRNEVLGLIECVEIADSEGGLTDEDRAAYDKLHRAAYPPATPPEE